MKNLNIGYDLQALQTENARNRGIGRYTENVINAIFCNDLKNHYKLFLNGNYHDKVKISTNDNCEIINIDYIQPNDFEHIENNLIQFLTFRNHNLDILHILSPFEGYPNQLPVINPYLEKLQTTICSTIYDLIPLNFSEHYFSDSNYKKWYFRQLKTIYDSDLLFAISEATRRDIINLLSINPSKVINIEGASAGPFYKIDDFPTKQIEKLRKKFGIKKRFVLYTGGIDFRKNIEKSIIAFSKIKKEFLENVSYVIVCKILENDKKRLFELAKEYKVEENLVLTGFVSDDELNLLYNACDLFIFPSLMEGFGLPILEAMKCGAPIIGSNTSSIPELIEDEEFLFDPNNEEKIALAINKMLSNEQLRKKSATHSLNKSKNYSWDKVAKKIIQSYNLLPKEIIENPKNLKKPKIAYFTPLPPQKSGIADYNATLLPFLAKYLDIDLFIDDYSCSDPFLTNNFNIYSYFDFEKISKIKSYDEVLYHFGNSDYHSYMFDMLKKQPGIVVLHDIYLSGVIFWNTGRLGKIDEFVNEVTYSHGEYGKKLADKAKKNLISWEKLIWELPVNKRVLDNATHIIVQSNWDKENILKLYPQLKNKISIVNHFSRPLLRDNKNQKDDLGFSQEQFLICTFGFVVKTKKLDSILENIKPFLEKTNSKFVVVGDLEDAYSKHIQKLVNDLNLSKSVIFTGYASEIDYIRYMKNCDVAIQLRSNIRGGGSGSVSRAVGAGIPTIISDLEPFEIFPDDIVIKIKPEDEKSLSKILDELYQNPEKRTQMGKKARKFIEDNLSVESCAKQYISVFNTIQNNEIK